MIEKTKTEEGKTESKTLSFTIGVDLGQAADSSCFTGIEKIKQTTLTGYTEYPFSRADLSDPMSTMRPNYDVSVEYRVRLLEKLKLQTSYVDVVNHLLALSDGVEERYQNITCTIALDISGVGRAVPGSMP